VEKPIYRVLRWILALSALHLTILIGLEARRFVEVRAQEQKVTAQLGQVEAEVNLLQEQVQRAQDPQYLSSLARQMGYVRSGETLYCAPQTPGTCTIP
jgi:cell division protein FtsB